VRTSFVLTVIGDDKPRIVEQLSSLVLGAGANWEESRMARLAGKFAGLLRVSVDAEQADALAERLRTLDAGDLTIVVERSAAAASTESRLYSLDLVGHDQPGIVRSIAEALAQHRVNIEELETEVTSAPMSGETLFHAVPRARSPRRAVIDHGGAAARRARSAGRQSDGRGLARRGRDRSRPVVRPLDSYLTGASDRLPQRIRSRAAR
jgi:glycine cleavage system regulatory protein